MLNLQFQVSGNFLPADHNYALYSALCHFQPKLKEIDWQLQTINGIPAEFGLIKIGDRSNFSIRIEEKNISFVVQLVRQSLKIGIHQIYIKKLQYFPIVPVDTCKSRIVIIKGYQQPRVFEQALERQIKQLGVEGEFTLGDRITIKIDRFTIVGFSCLFFNLKKQSSLLLQQKGLGGKRKLGCGIFYNFLDNG